MLDRCSFKPKFSPTKKHIHAYMSDQNVEQDGGLLKNSSRK